MIMYQSDQSFLSEYPENRHNANITDPLSGAYSAQYPPYYSQLNTTQTQTPYSIFNYDAGRNLNTTTDWQPPTTDWQTDWQPPTTDWQTDWQPQTTLNNDFSIEIVYGAGSENFTIPMKSAINEAAQTWEDTILESTFLGEHTLTIEVGGEDFGVDGFAAVASPNPGYGGLALDTNYNFMPIRGSSSVNINPQVIQIFSSNPEYFSDLMTHEFGHVMGIGTLWEINDLIDPISGNYYANTNAGRVYSNGYENIPLTMGEGVGSDGGHWREETFGNELMTHELEFPGTSQPLSEMTLASLEDIGWNVDYGVADTYPDYYTAIS